MLTVTKYIAKLRILITYHAIVSIFYNYINIVFTLNK